MLLFIYIWNGFKNTVFLVYVRILKSKLHVHNYEGRTRFLVWGWCKGGGTALSGRLTWGVLGRTDWCLSWGLVPTAGAGWFWKHLTNEPCKSESLTLNAEAPALTYLECEGVLSAGFRVEEGRWTGIYYCGQFNNSWARCRGFRHAGNLFLKRLWKREALQENTPALYMLTWWTNVRMIKNWLWSGFFCE